MDSLINNHYLFLPDPNWSHAKAWKGLMLIGKASLSRNCSVDVRIQRKKRDIGRRDFSVSTEHCKVRHYRWRVLDLTDCMWVVQVDLRILKPCGLQVDCWGNCRINYKMGGLMKRLK